MQKGVGVRFLDADQYIMKEQELSRHVGEKGSTHHRIQRVVGSRHPCGASGGKATAAALGPPKRQSAWEWRASPSLDAGGLFLVSFRK